MSTYGDIIAGIEATLKPAAPVEGVASPFKNALDGLDSLGDEDLVNALNAAATGDLAPAFGVLLPSGETNLGEAGVLKEELNVWIVVLDAARSRQAATLGDQQSPGVFALVDYVREKLHNVAAITGIVNPMLFAGHERLRFGQRSLTVAARIVKFKAPLTFADGN